MLSVQRVVTEEFAPQDRGIARISGVAIHAHDNFAARVATRRRDHEDESLS